MDVTMIRCVIATLNDIEVKGKDNLDKLLGSIMVLENVAQLMEQHTSEQAVKEDKLNG